MVKQQVWRIKNPVSNTVSKPEESGIKSVYKHGNPIVYKCNACYDQKWWCKGCGTYLKESSLLESGYSEKQAHFIVSMQQGDCTDLVPCFLCNRTGNDPDPSWSQGGRYYKFFWWFLIPISKPVQSHIDVNIQLDNDTLLYSQFWNSDDDF